MANTIDSALQLNRVLDAALRAFQKRLLPLTRIATVFRDQPLAGTDKIAVPYYPLATSASVNRQAGDSYKALASATTTDVREVTIDKNIVQAISFTGEERSRQPAFDPEQHGRLKGEKLADDVMADIFGVLGHGRNTSTSIAKTTAANFDENDVADLAKLCDDDNWPEGMRSLLMTPAFGWNLLKQPALLDQSQSGRSAPLTAGQFGADVLGFMAMKSAGVKSNSGTAQAITAVDTGADTITIADSNLFIDLKENDRVRIAGTTPMGGTDAVTYYFVKGLVVDKVAKTRTFSLSLTAGGAAVDLTTAGTSPTVARSEDCGAYALHNSAILTGFAPVEPSEAMRQQLYRYEILTDPDTDSGLSLEYRHFADADTNEEFQIIECHYGSAEGEQAAAKLVVDDAIDL